MKLTGISEKVFLDRYSLKSKEGKSIEKRPEEMWGRIAKAVSLVEKKSKQRKWEKEFYSVLKDFKYVPGGRILSGAGTGFAVSFYNCFVIQPIPLSKIKYNERGFNQAKIISTFFQKFLHFPIVDLLIRKKEILAQAQIKNKKERYLNIMGTFVINSKCRDAKFCVSNNIILVDDVVTSGSTVKEAVRVLKEAGAKKVYVLALAKG